MRTFSYISIILFGCFHFGWSARISIEPHTSNPKYPNAIKIVCEPDSSDMRGEHTTVDGLDIYKERLFNINQPNSELLSGKLSRNQGKNKTTIILNNPTAADVGAYKCEVRYNQNGNKYNRSDLGLVRADSLKGIERCYSIYENCQKGYTKPRGAQTPCVADMVYRTYTCLQHTEAQCHLKLTKHDFSRRTFTKWQQYVVLNITLNDAYKPNQGCPMSIESKDRL